MVNVGGDARDARDDGRAMVIFNGLSYGGYSLAYKTAIETGDTSLI